MPAPNSGIANLTGQVAVVTGAAGDIGRAVSIRLGQAGADIVTADIKPTTDTVEEVKRLGRRAIGVTCDVTQKSQVDAMAQRALSSLGRLDILVACAGVVSGTPILQVSESDWDQILAVNLKGVFLCVQAVYPQMRLQRYGKIVCFGSIAGKQGGVRSGPHYVAAKGGIHSFIKWLAKDGAAHSVYVNALAPGPVQTGMWAGLTAGQAAPDASGVPLGRFGTAEDIAEAVLFLASPASNWITGVVLDINGGMLMS